MSGIGKINNDFIEFKNHLSQRKQCPLLYSTEKLREWYSRGYDKRSKTFKTNEFHDSIMCPFFFIMTPYLGL